MVASVAPSISCTIAHEVNAQDRVSVWDVDVSCVHNWSKYLPLPARRSFISTTSERGLLVCPPNVDFVPD